MAKEGFWLKIVFDHTKGQVISEVNSGVFNSSKNNKDISPISALAYKKW